MTVKRPEMKLPLRCALKPTARQMVSSGSIRLLNTRMVSPILDVRVRGVSSHPRLDSMSERARPGFPGLAPRALLAKGVLRAPVLPLLSSERTGVRVAMHLLGTTHRELRTSLQSNAWTQYLTVEVMSNCALGAWFDATLRRDSPPRLRARFMATAAAGLRWRPRGPLRVARNASGEAITTT